MVLECFGCLLCFDFSYMGEVVEVMVLIYEKVKYIILEIEWLMLVLMIYVINMLKK